MEFEKQVISFIREHGLLTEKDRVLVALSGGADSVALLLLLFRAGYSCGAVHCNFHLRGAESDRDEAFVRALCERLGIGLNVVDFHTADYAAEHGISIEMAAREQRYEAFERLRAERGYAAVAVAHHRDDSVETVLLNLMRGTGMRGLTGIKPRNGYIVRPLLCVSRAEIEEWLGALGQDYVTDSTNLQNDYTRNKIRNEVLPKMCEVNPSAAVAIDVTSRRLADLGPIMEKAITDAISRVFDGERISVSGLKKEMAETTILFEILSKYGFAPAQTYDAYALLSAEPGHRIESATHVLLKDRDCLILSEKSGAGEFCAELEVSDGASVMLPDGHRLVLRIVEGAHAVKDAAVASLDASRLDGKLVVRRVEAGDRFVPFGMKGSRLLSDYMTDCHMNLLEKQAQTVVCSGPEIVWVTGRRTDNRYRVTASTACTVLLEITNR